MSTSKSFSLPIIVALVAVLGGLGLLLLGESPSSTTPPPTSANGNLILSESSWDWGDIPMSKGLITRKVDFQNTSEESITVTSMSTSCMCTKVTMVRSDGSMAGPKGMPGHGISPTIRETILPGEQGQLLVVYDPNAHGPNATGPIRRNVTLQTSSATQPSIQLSFSGNVVK